MKKEIPVISLIVASLFTIAGGFGDGYTFLSRGGVFGNMQTGNLIKFFVGLIDRGEVIWLYILPIPFFIVGCIITYLMNKLKHQNEIIVVVLFAAYLGCGFIPKGEAYDILCVCILSVTGAMQFQAFRNCLSLYYTSTMCTNNLRLFSISIAEKNGKKILFYLLIISLFCFGCILSVLLHKTMGLYSISPIASIYLVVFIVWLIPHKNEQPEIVEEL